MLQGNFYTLTATEEADNTFKAIVELNASHKIFEGHFPGQPIVPGVCMMQIIQEITSELTSRKLMLQKADTLKFLSMINPIETSKVNIELKHSITKEGKIKAEAHLFHNDIIYFKFKGTFTII